MIPYGHYPFNDDFEKFFAEKRPLRLTKKVVINLTRLEKDELAHFYHFSATVEGDNTEVHGLIYPGDNMNVCAVQHQREVPV